MKNYDKAFTFIQDRFLSDEIEKHGLKNKKTRALIRLACLTAIQTTGDIPLRVKEAVEAGATVTEIKETLYQTAPYIGYPKVTEALAAVNSELEKMGMDTEENDQSTTTDETRFDKGLAVQVEIFGENVIYPMRDNAPAETKHIQDCLSAHCFGDYYTRGTLDLKMRELITFVAICSIGGCESQAKAHVAANINVGNTKQLLIQALTTCLPYIGYPRTLNGLSCIDI
ncbi:MAG: carboxymuconolactone decarboxylase family protein [Oscillospiraceae bacterium]|nr:carboxymuconolactone decarboxylase family protein [Oscillospiraceae bacterium]